MSIKKTIFFSSLSKQANDNTVREYLSPCGVVAEVKRKGVVEGPGTWMVEFADEGSAKTALLLNGRQFLGSPVSIHPAVNPLLTETTKSDTDPIKRTVHVAGISLSVTEDMLKKHFEQCGVVTYVKVVGDDDKPSKFAFLEFSSEDGARQAVSLLGSVLADRALTVRPSTSAIIKPEVTPHIAEYLSLQDNDQMSVVARTIYASNIDAAATEEDCLQHFQKAGPVTFVKLAGDDRKPARFCFIEYMEPTGAFTCLTTMNNSTFRDRVVKVQQSTTPIIKPTTHNAALDKSKLRALMDRMQQKKKKEEVSDSHKRERRPRRRTSSSSSYSSSSSHRRRERRRRRSRRDRDRDRDRDRRDRRDRERSRRDRDSDRDRDSRDRRERVRDRDRDRRR
eukprot:TRINITY_DN3520_c5_g1_i1.p1 TRINITY_DN3520_c5_g1~~TRINITY_DN3520_c5_g1_i1.p1  ORF type:complete len:405 (+),score=71.27 TRINITY_DN3520_c5_g1_i1:39-1217(+)